MPAIIAVKLALRLEVHGAILRKDCDIVVSTNTARLVPKAGPTCGSFTLTVFQKAE